MFVGTAVAHGGLGGGFMLHAWEVHGGVGGFGVGGVAGWVGYGVGVTGWLVAVAGCGVASVSLGLGWWGGFRGTQLILVPERTCLDLVVRCGAIERKMIGKVLRVGGRVGRVVEGRRGCWKGGGGGLGGGVLAAGYGWEVWGWARGVTRAIGGYAAMSVESKRRMETNPRDNHGQQPSFKRHNVSGQNVARAYAAGNYEKRGYDVPHPLCNKCIYHHVGTCTVKCNNCKRVGHQTRDCRSAAANHGNRVGNKTGNQTGGNEATAKAYAIGRGGTNPDSNVVTDTFLLNNCYASMLFDSGADRSFVSSTFSALLDVAPSTLDTSYA
ncbi:putative reverse transcriptase domain-containing protein [Tanacetum coccineum]